MITIDSDKAFYTFSKDNAPAVKVNGGQVIRFVTKDAFGNTMVDDSCNFDEIVKDLPGTLPATGPVYVNGAKKGDTLRIEIINIELNDTSWLWIAPRGDEFVDIFDTWTTKHFNCKDGLVDIFGFKVPAAPMIGAIGVTPKESIATVYPGKHGGNMDTKEIRKGSVLYLPVEVEGALLGLGDCHMLQSDGENSTSALEASGAVTVKVDVIKDRAEDFPVLEYSNKFYLICSAETLDQAAKDARSAFVSFVGSRLGLSPIDAFILSGLVGELGISQMVNLLVTVKMSIDKSLLPSLEF